MYAESFVRTVSGFEQLENYFQFQKWCYNNMKLTFDSLYIKNNNSIVFDIKDTLVDFKDAVF